MEAAATGIVPGPGPPAAVPQPQRGLLRRAPRLRGLGALSKAPAAPLAAQLQPSRRGLDGALPRLAAAAPAASQAAESPRAGPTPAEALTPRGSGLAAVRGRSPRAPAAASGQEPASRLEQPRQASRAAADPDDVRTIALRLLFHILGAEVPEQVAGPVLEARPEISWLALCMQRCPAFEAGPQLAFERFADLARLLTRWRQRPPEAAAVAAALDERTRLAREEAERARSTSRALGQGERTRALGEADPGAAAEFLANVAERLRHALSADGGPAEAREGGAAEDALAADGGPAGGLRRAACSSEPQPAAAPADGAAAAAAAPAERRAPGGAPGGLGQPGHRGPGSEPRPAAAPADGAAAAAAAPAAATAAPSGAPGGLGRGAAPGGLEELGAPGGRGEFEVVCEEFTVSVEKGSPEDQLGLEVFEHRAVLGVKQVLPDGWAASWNAANPDRQIRRGDFVTSVNGLRGCSAALLQEIQGQRSLELALHRATHVREECPQTPEALPLPPASARPPSPERRGRRAEGGGPAPPQTPAGAGAPAPPRQPSPGSLRTPASASSGAGAGPAQAGTLRARGPATPPRRAAAAGGALHRPSSVRACQDLVLASLRPSPADAAPGAAPAGKLPHGMLGSIDAPGSAAAGGA